MSELPDPFQLLFAAMLAAAMIAGAPHLFMEWLGRIAEQQRAATFRQVMIHEDLLRRLATRDTDETEV